MNEQEFRMLAELPVHGPTASSGWNEQGEEPEYPRSRRGQYLVVDGRVAYPRTFLPSDLAALPGTSIKAEFCCDEGWYVPDLHWHGVRLASLLHAVGLEDAARCVQVSSGSYSTLLSREDSERALLALWLNEAVLPAEHGGPVRLVIPGNACYTSVKWVDHITVHEQTPATQTTQAIAQAIAGIWR
jgi:DMSO/TMAO reductase YedYZ molybdopterin-dependent catalytic subunit